MHVEDSRPGATSFTTIEDKVGAFLCKMSCHAYIASDLWQNRCIGVSVQFPTCLSVLCR